MTIGAMLREELFGARQYANKKKAALDSGGSFEEDFTKECWLRVLNKEIPLKAHVHRADDILTAIRIAKLFDLNLTLDHCTEGHLIAGEIKRSAPRYRGRLSLKETSRDSVSGLQNSRKTAQSGG